MTNYGKIDVLWYDVDWPLTPEQWESEQMNKMVFELQPEIIVNNRNGLEGDFSTPEQHIQAAQAGRSWETCMTLNDSWGFNRGDLAWKTPRTIVNNLAECAQGGGNYLLNIGPMPDGSVPPESVEVLEAVGKWLETNGRAIYETERGEFQDNPNANFTRRGNTLYVHPEVLAWADAGGGVAIVLPTGGGHRHWRREAQGKIRANAEDRRKSVVYPGRLLPAVDVASCGCA